MSEVLELLISLSGRWTQKVVLKAGEETGQPVFTPGDHVGLFPHNPDGLVSSLMARLSHLPHPEKPVLVEVRPNKGTVLHECYRHLTNCTVINRQRLKDNHQSVIPELTVTLRTLHYLKSHHTKVQY